MDNLGQYFTQYPWLFLLLQLWSIPWKGLALWTAARREEKIWFVLLLLVQTVGILDIIYIFLIAKHKFGFLKSRKSS